jgi:hypothetical protein
MTKRRGESPRNREGLRLDLGTTTEPQAGTNPHNTVQPNGSHRAQSRVPQRDLFKSPRRTRKNKGVQGTQQLGCDKPNEAINS